jgi:hypothetical protein
VSRPPCYASPGFQRDLPGLRLGVSHVTAPSRGALLSEPNREAQTASRKSRRRAIDMPARRATTQPHTKETRGTFRWATQTIAKEPARPQILSPVEREGKYTWVFNSFVNLFLAFPGSRTTKKFHKSRGVKTKYLILLYNFLFILAMLEVSYFPRVSLTKNEFARIKRKNPP